MAETGKVELGGQELKRSKVDVPAKLEELWPKPGTNGARTEADRAKATEYQNKIKAGVKKDLLGMKGATGDNLMADEAILADAKVTARTGDTIGALAFAVDSAAGSKASKATKALRESTKEVRTTAAIDAAKAEAKAKAITTAKEEALAEAIKAAQAADPKVDISTVTQPVIDEDKVVVPEVDVKKVKVPDVDPVAKEVEVDWKSAVQYEKADGTDLVSCRMHEARFLYAGDTISFDGANKVVVTLNNPKSLAKVEAYAEKINKEKEELEEKFTVFATKIKTEHEVTLTKDDLPTDTQTVERLKQIVEMTELVEKALAKLQTADATAYIALEAIRFTEKDGAKDGHTVVLGVGKRSVDALVKYLGEEAKKAAPAPASTP